MEYVELIAFLLGTAPYAFYITIGIIFILIITANLKRRSFNHDDEHSKN